MHPCGRRRRKRHILRGACLYQSPGSWRHPLFLFRRHTIRWCGCRLRRRTIVLKHFVHLVAELVVITVSVLLRRRRFFFCCPFLLLFVLFQGVEGLGRQGFLAFGRFGGLLGAVFDFLHGILRQQQRQ